MANEYLKPQTPLKDLNSENYFYPLTTIDQIIVASKRLSAFMNESNNLLNLTNIGTISSTGKFNLNGDLEIPNNHSFIGILGSNASTNYTNIGGLTWFNLNGTAGAAANVNDTPTSAWWYIIRNRHTNTENNYYTDLAIPFNSPSIYYKRVTGNYGSETIQSNRWIKVLDDDNYSSTLDSRYVTLGTNQTITGQKTFSTAVRIQYTTPNFYLRNTGTAADTYAIIRFGNSANENAAYIFLNGPDRTNDGGKNMFTIRNNVGDVRIDDHLIITGWTDHQEWIQINRSIYDQLLRFTSRGGYTSGWDSTQKIKYRSISSDYQGEMYYFGPRWKDTYATAGDANSSKTTAFQNTNYFQFREWSFNTNGTRTNYCEGYSLPNCDQARTAHAWYTIVTTKNPGALYWANVQCATGANTGTNPTFASATASNWFISSGNTGWRNSTHGGGWFMQDSWIRSYGSKNVYINTVCRADGGFRIEGNQAIYYAKTSGWGNKPSSSTNYYEVLQWWDLNNKRRGALGSGFQSDGWAFTHIQHQRTINNAETYTQLCLMIHDNGSRRINVSAPLYGAVWNDYAEFRKGQMNNLKPGQVVTEVGNGEMKLANQKLQKGCKILSDTFGFAIGETKECKLPIAVSGRVLVYCDTPKEELEPGDCLCANYTGNAIKMTRKEIIKYPDRIIGTVSEIPDYEFWHGGEYRPNIKNNPEDIVVNGRIWVYVR